MRVVQPRLTAIEGVQRADILGGRTFAMRIWLKPDRLAALEHQPERRCAQALANNNFLSAVGQTKGALVQVNLTANTDLRSVDEFKNLVIRQSGDQLVRLRDVADVVLGAEDYDSEVRFTGEKAVFMGIWVLPNANSLDVIKRVRTEMASIEKDLPTGLNGRHRLRRHQVHRRRHPRGDEDARAKRCCIVAIVIFLFLGSLRSVLVPLVAIPISLIGARVPDAGVRVHAQPAHAAGHRAVGRPGGGRRHRRSSKTSSATCAKGRRRWHAALLGARELVGPVIAMTITLAAVYAPIGLQGGLTGSLFREFAFTLAGAVFISGIVALTLSPVMSSKLLSAGREERGFTGRINRDFDRLRRLYGRVLDGTLSARPAVYIIWISLGLLAIPMFMFAPKELAPTEDQGFVLGIVEASADATIDQTTFYTDEVNRKLLSIPEAAQTFQITFPDNGFGGLVLKPWGERKRTVFQITPEIQSKVNSIPGIRTSIVLPPALPGGGSFPVEFVIASTADPQRILDFAQQLQQKAMESKKFMFMLVDTKVDQPEAELVLDRDKVASMGLNMATVGADLSALVGGNFVNRFNFDGRSYKVIPQLQRVERLNPSQFESTYVKGPNGKLVPLSTFATLKRTTEPRSLNRFQQLNAVKLMGVSFLPLDQALGLLETEAAKILPKGYAVGYTGESRQLRVEGSKFLPAFLLALILIFLVLAAQFNSFRDPLIILLGSVPLAMFGALLFCFLKMPGQGTPFFTNGWTTTLNIYSQVGLVTLVGLVSKNGILIVQFANELQRTGLSKIQAVRQAALVRLRPVLMTSVATVAGHFPLTLVTGAGAAARNSIGIVIVAGMSLGTIFTLLVIPSIYVLLAKQHVGEDPGAVARDFAQTEGDEAAHPQGIEAAAE